MSYTFYYSPQPSFTTNYTDTERNMLSTAMWGIQFEFRRMLEPLLGSKVGSIFKDLKTEFVETQVPELKVANALGMAFLNRNINWIPVGTGRWMFAPYTGIIAMENGHSVFWRLGSLPEFKSKKYTAGQLCNNVIHWLYNESHLKKVEVNDAWNNKYFGGSLTYVIPDLTYGWINREEIMDGIMSGRYKAGANPYWGVGSTVNKIAATEHELMHIKNFLVYGTTKPFGD